MRIIDYEKNSLLQDVAAVAPALALQLKLMFSKANVKIKCIETSQRKDKSHLG